MFSKLLCALCAIALGTTSHAAPVEVPIAAKSQIDARGVVALDRSVAFYKKYQSFSLVATELMYLDGEAPRRARYEINLQAPQRASLKATERDAQGKSTRQVTSRLIDDEFYYASDFEQNARAQSLGSDAAARQKALVQLFRILPSAGVSIVSLALGENPARQKMLSSVRYGEIRAENRVLKTVTLVITQPTKVSIELGLSPQTFALERVVLRGNSGGQKLTTITRFSEPISNWKGSQSATDAAVYSWKKFAPGVAFSAIKTIVRTSIHPVPLAAPQPKPKVSIDPKAYAIYARALDVYGDLDGLSVKWSASRAGTTENSAFDFDRKGRARVINGYTEEPLAVFDGKISSSLSHPASDGTVTYRQQIIDENDADWLAMQMVEGAGGLGGKLMNFLKRYDVLEPQLVQQRAEKQDFLDLRVILLKPQPFGGQACDLVRITSVARSPYIDNHPIVTEQNTFWFARFDGRLMRLQNRFLVANENSPASDSQVIEQTFNPKFTPATFKFTPPKGAVLTKN